MESLQQLVLLNLMTVHAALMVLFQQWQAFWSSTGIIIWLEQMVACCLGVLQTPRVDFENFIHCLKQRVAMQAGVRFPGVTSAIATVDTQVGVEKKSSPCRVVVKLESTEIDLVHSGDSHADEAGPFSSDRLVVMSNLPIPVPAFRSAFTPKDNHQRLVLFPRKSSGPWQIGQPVVLGPGSLQIGKQDGDQQCNRYSQGIIHDLYSPLDPGGFCSDCAVAVAAPRKRPKRPN